jgi:hypothetical protein
MTELLHTNVVEPDVAPAISDRVGRRRFIRAVGAVGAAAAAGSLTSVVPSATANAAVPAGAGKFVPLPVAVRAIDTRDPGAYSFTAFASNHVRLPMQGRHGIPANAIAVVATVTAVNGPSPNWLAILPSGQPISTLLAQNRLASTLNMGANGEVNANLAQVRLGPDGVELYSLTDCDMIVDVIGYYSPVTSATRDGRFVSLPEARRAYDSRPYVLGDGGTVPIDVTDFVPADASAAVINLTVTDTAGPSYYTVYPYSLQTVPTVSSLNVSHAGAVRAAAVIVPVPTAPDGRRRIKVFALRAANIIVDVTGYYTNASAPFSEVGLFVPVDPVRILDTRDAGQIGRLWPGWTVEGLVPGAAAANASAIAANLTGVVSRAPGYLTMAAARQPVPGTSNLNFAFGGMVVPNHVITPITASFGFQVFSSHGAHVLVDYMGYFTGTPKLATVSAPVNPAPPAIGPDWVMRIPAIGLTSTVRGGDPIRVTDSGYSWHWTGTGFMGQDAHVAFFAHRTEHGGVYRHLNYLSGGDIITVTTLDRREYVYQVVRRDLTDSRTANILDATRFHPGTTLSLIACSRTDFTPTSLSWRIVVTAELIGWSEF